MQRKENVNDTLKAVLQKHWTMLIQAVRQLAQAVGNRPPESEEVAAFFHDFMDGYWDVFEETTAHSKEELKQADRQSQMLQDQICSNWVRSTGNCLISMRLCSITGRARNWRWRSWWGIKPQSDSCSWGFYLCRPFPATAMEMIRTKGAMSKNET